MPIPRSTSRVTVRHLLTHTSGIDGDDFLDTGRGDDCLERYVGAVERTSAQNHPLGETWSYCNSGYSLLGSGHRAAQRHDVGRGAPGAAIHAARARPHRHPARGGAAAPAPPWGTSASRRGAAAARGGLGAAAVGRAGRSHQRDASRDVLAFARLHLDGRTRGRTEARPERGERRRDDRTAGRRARTSTSSATPGASAGSASTGTAGGSSATTGTRSGRPPSSASFPSRARGNAAGERRKHARPVRGSLPRDVLASSPASRCRTPLSRRRSPSCRHRVRIVGSLRTGSGADRRPRRATTGRCCARRSPGRWPSSCPSPSKEYPLVRGRAGPVRGPAAGDEDLGARDLLLAADGRVVHALRGAGDAEDGVTVDECQASQSAEAA